MWHPAPKIGKVARSKGNDVVSKLRYNCRGIAIKKDGLVQFTPISEIVFSKQFVPEVLNLTDLDVEQLWELAAAAEVRKDAVEARTLDFTFPSELTLPSQIEVCFILGRWLSTSYNLISNFAIHHSQPGSADYNPHVTLSLANVN